MKPDYYSLLKVGLSRKEIAEISECQDREIQIRTLRKYRYDFLDEIHIKQQSLNIIDYLIRQIKEQQ